jgi:hypothetical protein
MPDEPTTSELMRRLEDVRTDLKEDLQSLAGRLDGKVSADMLALQQQAQDERTAAIADRLKAIEEAARKAAEQRAADRRLILTALVAPVLIVILTVWLQARGAGA